MSNTDYDSELTTTTDAQSGIPRKELNFLSQIVQSDTDWISSVERAAIIATLIAVTVQLVMVLILEGPNELTPLIGGPGSIAAQALIATLILCVILTPYAFLKGIQHRNQLRPPSLRARRRWAAIPVTIGVTLFLALLVVGGFEIFGRTFEDVMMDRASSATVLLLISGLLAYNIVRNITPVITATTLVNLSAFYLMGTLFFAAYFNDNPLWWQRSFSYLGMTDSNSRYIFDVGLLFTGILIVTWQVYFMEGFRILEAHGKISHRSVEIIRWVLVVAGIALATVGVVRFGIGPFFNVVHDVAATGMGVLVGLLMVSLYRIVPGYDRSFYTISILMAIATAVAAVFKITGSFNLVGLELAAFSLATLWLVLFHRNTELLVMQTIEEGLPPTRDNQPSSDSA
jgi:hypothetical protein